MLFDYNFKRYNIRIILYMLMLSFIGILAIWSATNQNRSMEGKQIIGIVVGLIFTIGLSLIDYHKILSFSIVIYLLCVISLAAVLFFGKSKGIATRWIVLPFIGQIQPAEFVKIGLMIFFSWYFQKYQENINHASVIFLALGLFALPLLLIGLQPNLSTAIVTTVMVAAIVFTTGISYRWILGALALAVPSGILFLYLLQYNMIPFIQEYQARRILTWLDPTIDAAAYYQQENSIMAIGSGQLWGKGLNTTEIASVKNGNFLSEEQTDFIFAIIGEELGFVGCLVVIGLILALVYECLLMANRAKDLSGRLLCTGMAILIAFQSFANIAVATGIFPNTGLPLPFISYGVSSLLSIFMGMGIVINVGLQRKFSN
ncbi:MAG: FtsW/RodA/SpoVE family cell cycle protein [Hungatella sp.]